MKLIEEIIEILSDSTPNIEQALMKTKVLLYKLGEKDLTSWIKNELEGYESENDLPTYRIIHCGVMINAASIPYRSNEEGR